ncbi:MAG: AarF/UbiB family protein, partial [Alphaproteobacteria bacterium]
ADMHPGNLFLKANGDIAVVDFGIVGKIDKKTRIAVAEVLIGFLHRDYDKIAKIHIDAGFVPADTNLIDLSLSCRKIGEMIVGVNVKDISIAKLLTALIDLTKNYKMEAKPELLLLQKTLLLVEGVGVSLDEHLNIWDLARPFVKKWAKTNIGFDAKIRDAIVDLFSAVKEYLKNK